MKLLKEWDYEAVDADRGYTGKTLYLNVGDQRMEEKPVTDEMKEKFVGGRGFDLRLLWDAVNENTKWDSPENEIVISGGPLCGITQYPGTGKYYAAFISPLSNQVYDSNSGGHFAPLLKFAGYDALELQGKSDRDIVVFIDGDNGKVQIYESPFGDDVNAYTVTKPLHEYFAGNENELRFVSVISAGQAANHSYWGCLNTSFYDVKRKDFRLKQAGRGGGGTVFRDKKIAALVVRKRNWTGQSTGPEDPQELQKPGAKINKEIFTLDNKMNQMRKVGTTHLNQIMNTYHLLPTNNYKYGQHPDAWRMSTDHYKRLFTQNIPDGCWIGCTLACAHGVDHFKLQTGPWKGKEVLVDGPEYETAAGLGSNIGIFDPFWTIEANFYADHYGMDTISLGTGLAFVCECYEKGFLNKEITNGLNLNFGQMDDLMELIHRMGEGKDEFAKEAAKGIKHFSETVIEKYGAPREIVEKFAMQGQGVEVSEYVCKESVAQWGGFFLTLKGPQHDEAWLIFMDRVNKQLPTFDDKAEALHYFPNFRTWFSLVGLCKLPWNDIEPADNKTKYPPQDAAKVPEHVDNYVRIFKAVTGRDFDKDEMIRQAERVYNYQRVFQLRMGRGTRADHNIPDRALGPVFYEEWMARAKYYDEELEKAGIDPEGLSVEKKIEKLQEHRHKEWEKLKDAVYKRRGWDRNGIPTLEKLQELGMDLPEVVEVVKAKANPEDKFED